MKLTPLYETTCLSTYVYNVKHYCDELQNSSFQQDNALPHTAKIQCI